MSNKRTTSAVSSVATYMAQQGIIRRWELVKSYIGWEDYIAVALILLGALGYFESWISFIPYLTDFYTDIRSELIGIGITVLIIDNVNEMYRRRAEKERLILQMGSPDNGLAIEAVRQLVSREWLFDGSLQRADLIKANLCGAHLSGADLRWARMNGAQLKGAYLGGAKLRGATLFEADLSGAKLGGAKLSGVDLTRANLRRAKLGGADLSDANLKGAKYDSATQWPYRFDYKNSGAKEI